jgi:hypothetical protein
MNDLQRGFNDGISGLDQADYESDAYYTGYDRGVEAYYREQDFMDEMEMDVEYTDGPLY